MTEDDDSQTAEELYAAELSVAPGVKLGGCVRWIQDPEIPKCEKGHTMSHLLTIDFQEFDRETRPRWCPKEDQEGYEADVDSRPGTRFPAFRELDGAQFIFTCRECPDWPVASVFQR